MPKVIPPVPDADDQFFWDGVAAGTLLLQRCAACKTKRHPPSPMCAVCLSTERESFEASGRGTVHSWIASHHPSRPDDEPRIVVLVDLDEGLRLVSNLQEIAFADVHPGLPVEVFFAEVDGVTLPQFRPSHARPSDDPSHARPSGDPSHARPSDDPSHARPSDDVGGGGR